MENAYIRTAIMLTVDVKKLSEDFGIDKSDKNISVVASIGEVKVRMKTKTSRVFEFSFNEDDFSFECEGVGTNDMRKVPISHAGEFERFVSFCFCYRQLFLKEYQKVVEANERLLNG